MYPAGVSGLETRYVTAPDGVRLRVVAGGPRDGPPVLLLHGWAASLYSFRFLLEDLPRGGYRTYALDFRGHGFSGKPRGDDIYTRDVLVRDVLHLLAELGIERAAVVGWSMGGAVALRLAIEHPERLTQLVLVNPAGLTRIPMIGPSALLSPAFLDVLAPWLVPRWVVATVLRWASNGGDHLTERDIDEYWAPARDVNYARAARSLLRDFDWSAADPSELASVHVPTLVVLGGADRLVTGVGPVARRIPNARVAVFPGAGHMVHEERRHEVNRAILDFLGDAATA